MHRISSRLIAGLLCTSTGAALIKSESIDKTPSTRSTENTSSSSNKHSAESPHSRSQSIWSSIKQKINHRAFGYSEIRRIRLYGHNRHFHLVLRPITPESSPFSSDLEVDVDGMFCVIRHPPFLYEGYVEGDPNSRVYGSIFHGAFDGNIHMSDGNSYTVEKTSKYHGMKYHSNLYHLSIFHDNKASWEYVTYPQMAPDLPKTSPYRPIRYREPATWNSDFHRINDSKDVPKTKTCTMYIKVDHTLYQQILSNEGYNDPERTRNEIISLIYTHMTAVNDIYRNTIFEGGYGIKFAVKKISIQTSPACVSSAYPMREVITQFLDHTSREDTSNFGLAYTLTYRDFGMLGLAIRAGSDNLKQDVLAQSTGLQAGLCGVFHPQLGRSLNTGVITLLNKGKRVPLRKTQLTLAHEIGHSLGADHDPVSANAQGSLMQPWGDAFTKIVPASGKFSRRSIREMSEVLDYVQSLDKYEPAQSHEGNGFRSKRNCLQ